MLVFKVQQSDSALCIHISPYFLISLPCRSPKSIGESPLSRFSLVIYFIHSTNSVCVCVCVCVCISIPISQFLPPSSLFLSVHMFVVHICVSSSALQISSSVPFFYIPHVCVDIQYLFFSFSLHSV